MRIEAIFFEAEPVIVPLDVADPIILDAMAQDQILRTGGSANRVGLHEAEMLDGAPKSRRFEEGIRDGLTAEVFERHNFEDPFCNSKRKAPPAYADGSPSSNDRAIRQSLGIKLETFSFEKNCQNFRLIYSILGI